MNRKYRNAAIEDITRTEANCLKVLVMLQVRKINAKASETDASYMHFHRVKLDHQISLAIVLGWLALDVSHREVSQHWDMAN